MNRENPELLIRDRIAQSKFDLANHEFYAIFFHGYIAATLEWGVVGVGDFERLLQILPKIAEDPATDILLGRGKDF